MSLVVALGMGCGGGDDGDGGGGPPDGATLPVEPTAFRVTLMELRDPHAFAFNGAFDVTGTVNDQIGDAMTMDADDPPDGNLDLSIVVVHRPLDQSAGSIAGDVVFPDCTTPVLSTSCTLTAGAMVVQTTLTNAAATCLDAVPGTTSGFSPAVEPTQGPCFSTEAETLDVSLGELVIPLIDTQLAGRYVNDPADGLDQGLIRGFLTQEAADNATIPESVAIVGGDPVSSVLRDEDKDPGPGGEDGWWFYLNYDANLVPYTTQ